MPKMRSSFFKIKKRTERDTNNTRALFSKGQDISLEELIALEVKRLSEQYGKTFLDCSDLMQLTGLGRDNVRALMNSKLFPVTKIGNRMVVSILAFVTWQLTQQR